MELIFSLLQASRCRHTAPPGESRPEARRCSAETRSSSRQRKTVSRQCQDGRPRRLNITTIAAAAVSAVSIVVVALIQDPGDDVGAVNAQEPLLGQRGPVEGDLPALLLCLGPGTSRSHVFDLQQRAA